MPKNLPFRAWFYFRQGWSTYFAFVFSAINTLVVTYYLAIERAPFLKEIFPTFATYVIIVTGIGIPLLVLVGYAHYKRIPAITEELEVAAEVNPYWYKIPPGWNSEVVFPLYLAITEMLVKLSKDEKLSDENIKKITELQEKINLLLQGGYLGSYSRKPKSDKPKTDVKMK